MPVALRAIVKSQSKEVCCDVHAHAVHFVLVYAETDTGTVYGVS